MARKLGFEAIFLFFGKFFPIFWGSPFPLFFQFFRVSGHQGLNSDSLRCACSLILVWDRNLLNLIDSPVFTNTPCLYNPLSLLHTAEWKTYVNNSRALPITVWPEILHYNNCFFLELISALHSLYRKYFLAEKFCFTLHYISWPQPLSCTSFLSSLHYIKTLEGNYFRDALHSGTLKIGFWIL